MTQKEARTIAEIVKGDSVDIERLLCENFPKIKVALIELDNESELDYEEKVLMFEDYVRIGKRHGGMLVWDTSMKFPIDQDWRYDLANAEWKTLYESEYPEMLIHPINEIK